MIVKELYRTDAEGEKLYRTYSNEGLMIRKVGTNEIYTEAIDIEKANYVYEETAEPIKIKEE